MTNYPTLKSSIPAKAGVGFKPEHARAIFAEDEPSAGWFEVHAENYMGAGGPPHAMLTVLRERFPVSVHGVGLSIGAEKGLDPEHLKRLAAVVERYEPGLVSEHLAWSTHDTHYLNDLLPLPYTQATLELVVSHIGQVQDALKRQILLENPSTYIRFETSTMSELDFLSEVAKRSGCGLLLDVNNVFVSATNHGYSPEDYIDGFPLHAVGEIHLGGHAEDEDDLGAPLLIDSHDREVVDPVWALYERLIGKTGRMPTLVEWDSDLPDWPVLAAEAKHAAAILDRAAGKRNDVRAA
ncbi:MAG: DUF692 domain-containing protein [Rhodobiaceae bacterium]|nr:DUF692 domain-containing protein [Rhodobiaceae bacterium]MCC0049383.1 DUF692 domain-containing protein [Rhodobiaceae bacterium]